MLLAWTSLRAFNGGAEQFSPMFAELGRLEMVEATLQRDLLSARAGILRNYDPLVRETRELRASVAHLREIVAPNSTAAAVTERLDVALSRQEALVEQFKTDNALLQNSLSYFARFAARIDPAVSGDLFAQSVSSVVAAVLRLTLDTSAASARNVHDRLTEL
ncbi:MAG TPA: DAHL domain-containing protein, partial [Acetobacteraceae bacterium]|nr:DAHL domain-containing protein [Acetobacteraceae bacterium]